MTAIANTGCEAGRLSCYTAALARYAEPEFPGFPARLAASIRLGVREHGGGLEFTHHRYDIARLSAETSLIYAGTAKVDTAFEAIIAELATHGRALVVANTAALPWSPGFGAGDEAHWLLVDGRGPRGWHVVDVFDALLPSGTHEPFDGWLRDREFTAAIGPRRRPDRMRVNRDRHVFGVEVALPDHEAYWWLTRSPATEPATPVTGWLTGAEALAAICEQFCADPAAAAYQPDVWAAARHRQYQLSWQLARGVAEPTVVEPAVDAWRSLPMALRFAVEAQRRGKARPSLLRHQFAALAAVDAECPVETP